MKLRKRITFFNSFRAKVTLLLIFGMILSAVFCNYGIYKFALDAQFSQLREKLMIIAQMAALSIDTDVLKQVPLDRSGIHSEPYREILAQLEQIKSVDPVLRYVYTMAKTGQEGIWQFIVDEDADPSDVKMKRPTSFPGDLYDASRFPEMMRAFDGPAADKKFEIDEWGASLSGYAPIYDRRGQAVAMIGVDIEANDVYAMQQGFRRRGAYVLIVGLIFSLVFGSLFSNRIMRRLKKLVEGTKRIREGDFKHQVRVGGRDEISELAHSFNVMAKSLFLSSKRMHKYFYRAMQALVRVLEAKDAYTRGHSDRVAEYAEKIAVKMNFPEEDIELIKDAARLHDVGKLGIEKAILNKKEQLTDAEWEVIRGHPVLGEEILRPVVFDKHMLAMVRSHHERYDGCGYPDRVRGEDINHFSHIISVADAYDAMTSDRAYRKALSQEEAIKEIKKNKGIQFNPGIADCLIAVLEEEGKIP